MIIDSLLMENGKMIPIVVLFLRTLSAHPTVGKL
jgi:hypothetical protein